MSETLSSLDQAFEKAIQDGVYAGGVAFARNKSGMDLKEELIRYTFWVFPLTRCTRTGTLDYKKAFGQRSLAEESNEPMQLDTVFAAASATKLITSIAVLQVVERGLIGLDDDLTDVIPLLGKQEVLHGIDDDGKFILKKRENPLTLR